MRKIVHGYPWGDEFPTWSFEVARCVFVYTYSRPSLPSLSRRGEHTRNSYVCILIYKKIYLYINIVIQKHLCLYVYLYIGFFDRKQKGLTTIKTFSLPLKFWLSKRE